MGTCKRRPTYHEPIELWRGDSFSGFEAVKDALEPFDELIDELIDYFIF